MADRVAVRSVAAGCTVVPASRMRDAATTYFNNAAATDQGDGDVPRTQVVVRETVGPRPRAGYMMLVPPQAPRYLLVPNQVGSELLVYDLLQPDKPGVAVVHGEEIYVYSAAVSTDGESIFLGCRTSPGGGLRMYDTARLLEAATTLLGGGQAEDQVDPRGRAPNIAGQSQCSDAAFSQDATRLFVLWSKTASGITVHDPSHPELPVLRELPFSGDNFQFSNNQLACAGGLLAACAGGGYGSTLPSSSEEARMRCQVKLWQVGVDGETDLCTMNNPDLADAVALSPDGSLLAVGLHNGMVWLLSLVSSDDTEEEPAAPIELEPVEEVPGDPRVIALCFSRDGAWLVAGRALSDDFIVYDVRSAAIIARFIQPKSSGYAAAFFPSRDVLVTGGDVTQPCVFHRVLGPAPRVDLTLLNFADITGSDVVSDDKLGLVVAIACGSNLEVHTEGGKILLEQDLGEQMFTSVSSFRTPVRLHPSLKFVACLLAKKVVVVLSIADGTESFRFTFGGCQSIRWSPDGALLALATHDGVWMFSTHEGFAEVQHLEAGVAVGDVAFDGTMTRAAAGTLDNRVIVWDIVTWTPTRELKLTSMVVAVCLSHNGNRLAYWEGADDRVVVLSLDAESDEPQQLVLHVNAMAGMMFSPDENFLLCCSSVERSFDQHRMRVLDLATGTDAAWGELLRTMALPVTGHALHGRSLGWAQFSPVPSAHTTNTTGNALQWVLYGAVGNRFVVMDVQNALYAVHDNAWTVDQLMFCVSHQQEHVGSVVESAPHCSNVRHIESGDTVLHCLARMYSVDLVERWLEKCPQVTPVANVQGKTAVEVALQFEQADVAQAIWSKLNPSMTSVSASLVMQQLKVISNTHPHLVRQFLMDVEPKVVRTLATFRTDLAQAAEVCGLPTATLAGNSSDSETTSGLKNATESIPSIWANKCHDDTPKTLVASKVVVLPDLLGDANSSPFHAIVKYCDASVFESKLLQLIVQHKWEEGVRSRRLRSIALYWFAVVMGSLAMVSSVASIVATSTVDALQGCVVVIEISALAVEAFELAREGCASYFTGPWNVLDVASSTLLLVGSAFHFAGVVDGVRSAGALGVALKIFGSVDYLRSFAATGSLVRMISVIITDMVPFMTILLLAMLGCMLFFTINLTSDPDLDSDGGLGLFRTLVTVYHMTLGIGAGIDTEHASVTTVLVVTIFMSFVVVVLLNLLIAIMGDSYEKVKESEHVEAIRERARIIVAEETRFPDSFQYYRFMHFVEAIDSTDKFKEIMWEGVTKRVSQMLSVEASRLEHNQQELDNKLVELNTQLKSEINNKFEQLELKLDLLLERSR